MDREVLESSQLPGIRKGEPREIIYLIHRVEDVTDVVKIGRDREAEELLCDAVEVQAKQAEEDFLTRPQELNAAKRGFVEISEKMAQNQQQRAHRINAAMSSFEYQVVNAMEFPEWQKPYQDAVLETNGERLPAKLRRAQWAIERRKFELTLLATGSPREWEALEHASSVLEGLRHTI